MYCPPMAWSLLIRGIYSQGIAFAGQSASRLGYAVGGCDSFFLGPQFRIKQDVLPGPHYDGRITPILMVTIQ